MISTSQWPGYNPDPIESQIGHLIELGIGNVVERRGLSVLENLRGGDDLEHAAFLAGEFHGLGGLVHSRGLARESAAFAFLLAFTLFIALAFFAALLLALVLLLSG